MEYQPRIFSWLKKLSSVWPWISFGLLRPPGAARYWDTMEWSKDGESEHWGSWSFWGYVGPREQNLNRKQIQNVGRIEFSFQNHGSGKLVSNWKETNIRTHFHSMIVGWRVDFHPKKKYVRFNHSPGFFPSKRDGNMSLDFTPCHLLCVGISFVRDPSLPVIPCEGRCGVERAPDNTCLEDHPRTWMCG